MPDYQKSKIYKIINPNIPDKTYYGSTSVKYLSQRFAQHKKWNNECKSNILFQKEGAKIVLVENFPCNDKVELKKRERWYIENNQCINKTIPGRTKKEWQEDNKDKIKKQKKIYAKKNKDKIKKYYQDHKDIMKLNQSKRYNEKVKILPKEKLGCRICKCEVLLDTFAIHCITKKHQSNLIGSKS